jgi:hypothetical protein
MGISEILGAMYRHSYKPEHCNTGLEPEHCNTGLEPAARINQHQLSLN